MSDPLLKQAMKEIQTILHNYDIAGQITLVSQSHAEFLYELSPSWSLVTLKNGSVRFRSKKENFDSEKHQMHLTELSVHILAQIRDLSVLSFSNMQKIMDELSEHLDINHFPYSDFEPHRDN